MELQVESRASDIAPVAPMEDTVCSSLVIHSSPKKAPDNVAHLNTHVETNALAGDIPASIETDKTESTLNINTFCNDIKPIMDHTDDGLASASLSVVAQSSSVADPTQDTDLVSLSTLPRRSIEQSEIPRVTADATEKSTQDHDDSRITTMITSMNDAPTRRPNVDEQVILVSEPPSHDRMTVESHPSSNLCVEEKENTVIHVEIEEEDGPAHNIPSQRDDTLRNEPSNSVMMMTTRLREQGVDIQEYVDLYILAPDASAAEASALPDITSVVTEMKSLEPHNILVIYPNCILTYQTIVDLDVNNRHDELERLKAQFLTKYLDSLKQYTLAQALASVDSASKSSIRSSQNHDKKEAKNRSDYIESLWPKRVSLKNGTDIRDHYGFEIHLTNNNSAATTAGDMKARMHQHRILASSSSAAAAAAAARSANSTTGNLTLEDDDDMPPQEYAYTQDSWVQCDSCEKWRRLPDHVDTTKLPSTWYCQMNRWDKVYNNCTEGEENVLLHQQHAANVKKESENQERSYLKQFLKRMKNMAKLRQTHKDYTKAMKGKSENKDSCSTNHNGSNHHKSNNPRKFYHHVQCARCFKRRPLLSGMDPSRLSQPFVCWMNSWDELHASCSVPEEMHIPFEELASTDLSLEDSSVLDPTASSKSSKKTTNNSSKNNTTNVSKKKSTMTKKRLSKKKEKSPSLAPVMTTIDGEHPAPEFSSSGGDRIDSRSSTKRRRQ